MNRRKLVRPVKLNIIVTAVNYDYFAVTFVFIHKLRFWICSKNWKSVVLLTNQGGSSKIKINSETPLVSQTRVVSVFLGRF